jgi:ABC-type transporter Mla subunit MlaD
MRRIATLLAVVGLAAFTVFALGAGGGGGTGGSPKYWVELDNAFGLVNGGDLKIAGVRAGTITDLRLDKNTLRALVQFKVTQNGFGSLRTDATCDTRPQSLIGEYYLNCNPGSSPHLLKTGSVIPVTQTSSVIGPDLVNDIMREPYKDRFRIILNEFGAAAAGNAANLQAAIIRASPALRATDQVLAILGKQNRILANLATEGDAVIGALAANKANVGRWADQANRLSTISASRAAQIQQGFRLLPGFLEQLTPAMQSLGQLADKTTPALRNLDASASQLRTFLNQLGPFSQASTPAFHAFGQAAATGIQAVQAATPTVAQLAQFSSGVPELSNNLQIVLQHLDNRAYAAEKDPRSPGGMGWTGLEDLLNYTYWQSTSITLYDSQEHMLNVGVFVSPTCSPYPDPKQVAAAYKASSPLAKCISWLGPDQPGVTTTDPTAAAAQPRAEKKKASKPITAVLTLPISQTSPFTPVPTQTAPAKPAPSPTQLPSLSQLLSGVTNATNSVTQALGSALQPQTNGSNQPPAKQLLNYLLGQ